MIYIELISHMCFGLINKNLKNIKYGNIDKIFGVYWNDDFNGLHFFFADNVAVELVNANIVWPC